MPLIDIIKKRRSIRRFKKETPDMKLISKCIEAACHAPSANNSQPWHFLVIRNKGIIEKLSETHLYSKFLKEAPMAIVVLADKEKSPIYYIEDCSCAVMLLMLQAAELSLGTCWGAIHGRPEREAHVRKFLDISVKYSVVCLIGIGYPDIEPGEKKVKSFEEAAEVVE